MKDIFSGKMIVCDLDGTLVTSRYEIPQRNLDAIRYFIDNGGVFSLATGRSVESARQYAEKMKLKAPVIVMNGAVIYDYKSERIVWSHPLGDVVRGHVEAVSKEYPLIGIEVYSGRQLYMYQINQTSLQHAKNEALEPKKVNSLDDIPKPWHKILYAGSHEELLPIAQLCESRLRDGAEYVFTMPIYYEMMPVGVDKGSALRILAQMLGVEIKNTYAAGDYYNDVKLIKAAGKGILSGNSPEEIRHHADAVLCRVEDGLAAELVGMIERGEI